jgi:hypothetical protein
MTGNLRDLLRGHRAWLKMRPKCHDREDLRLKRQEGASRVDQIDAGRRFWSATSWARTFRTVIG